MELDIRYSDFFSKLERLKKRAQDGGHYWMARDIQVALGYSTWENFRAAIVRARMACESAGVFPDNQFRETTKLVSIGSGAERGREDWFLSRYACYLIAMNSDPSKQEVGYAMTYFAVQTRIQEKQNTLTGELKRAMLRNRVKDATKSLNAAAQASGVQNYAVFHDAGYKGLYGGLGQKDIKAKKGIPEKESLLDCVERTELAANEFRITQTESKLVREKVRGEEAATGTHYEVGKEVRATIRKLGGEMPENLPAAPSIKKLAAKVKSKPQAPSGDQFLLTEKKPENRKD